VQGQSEWYTAPNTPPDEVRVRQARALDTYRRGLELARRTVSAGDLEPAWGEPELLMNLAWAHLNGVDSDPAAARRYAEEALRLVPHWRYVREQLLPQIVRADRFPGHEGGARLPRAGGGGDGGMSEGQPKLQGEAYSLVRLTPGRPTLLETMTPAERRIVDDHFQYLLGLRDRGIVVHAGRTTDPGRLWGIVIMRASTAEAERLMAEDPAIRSGVQRFEVFPYSMAIER
jgi:hypothetical protein